MRQIKVRRHPPAPPSEKTRWAYFMRGMQPDIDDAQAVERVTRSFGPKHPAWMIAANPGRRIDGQNFRSLREHVVCLSQTQVATYLRVSASTVAAWERNRSPVPFAAFETLRLLSESTIFKLSHHVWDGWFVEPKTGALVSPDIGRLAVLPAELNTLPSLYAERTRYRMEAERLRAELEAAQAENTRLRTLYLVDGVTDELHAMQGQLSQLLSRIATARVVPMPTASTIKPRKVATR